MHNEASRRLSFPNDHGNTAGGGGNTPPFPAYRGRPATEEPPRRSADIVSGALAGKRCFDRAIALLLICMSAPVMAVIAVAILYDTGGPVLFTQSRSGLNKRGFRIYKFRTMSQASCR